MDSDVVVKAEGLGKKYRICHQQQERYTTFRDVLAREFCAPFRWLFKSVVRSPSGASFPAPRSTTAAARGDFWALKDVSFEIKRGQVVGIIGRNGAGKSTLLKILSRITEPSTGTIELRGRVASLLEVGTGFHPELTGRENIFLNGAILGMSRAEIRKMFDEIVAFANIERFLDTPVKRYSSGMYVRLAFSIAAHTRPDILIVDEVLAVGDTDFQRKCLNRMQQICTSGQTVLFVSHQMAAVQNLCRRGLFLANGCLVSSGTIDEVLKQYLESSAGQYGVCLLSRQDRTGSGLIRFTDVSFLNGDGARVTSFMSGETARFDLVIENSGTKAQQLVRIAIGIDTNVGQRIAVLSTHFAGSDFFNFPPGKSRVRLEVPRLPLCPGTYPFTLFVSVDGDTADWIKHAGAFDVAAGDFYGTGHLPAQPQALFLLDHSFMLEGTSKQTKPSGVLAVCS